MNAMGGYRYALTGTAGYVSKLGSPAGNSVDSTPGMMRPPKKARKKVNSRAGRVRLKKAEKTKDMPI